MANDCLRDLQIDHLEINECILCASMLQPDPSWGTCNMIGCKQVHKCLVNRKCSKSADDWMDSFSCTWIEYWGCSDYKSCLEFGYGMLSPLAILGDGNSSKDQGIHVLYDTKMTPD